MNKADIVKAQKQVLEVYETRLRSARIAQNAETVKEIKALLKSKQIEKAFAIFKTNDLQKISDFFTKEFAQYPEELQATIFEYTASYVVDGKSIYDNPSINVFNLLRALDVGDASFGVGELFKSGFRPTYVADLFPTYLKATFNSMSTLDDLFKEIEFLAQLSYTDEQTYGTKEELPYIHDNIYGNLISHFFDKIGKPKANQINLTEYLDRLKAVESKYPNLQKIGFLKQPRLFTPLINEDNVLQFVEIPETFDALFDNSVFLETMKDLFIKLDTDTKIEYLKRYINHPKFKTIRKPSQTIAKMLRQGFLDKTEFLDFEKFIPILEVLTDEPTNCVMLFSNTVPDGLFKELKEKFEALSSLPADEQLQQKLEIFKNYISDFANYGVIDTETYDNVLKIVQKFNKGMTLEKLKSIIAKNKNLKNVMQDIAFSPKLTFRINGDTTYPDYVITSYDRALYDFEAIFPRSRLQALPELAAYKKMTLEQKRNFDVKTWGQFASLPIFSQDDNTKRALVEFIAVMGLFETDADVEKRKQFAYGIATNYGLLTNDDYSYIDYYLCQAVYGSGYQRGMSAGGREIAVVEKFFERVNVRQYAIRPFVTIPDDIADAFAGVSVVMSERRLSDLKKLTGSYGKKVNNFLSPYAKVGTTYRLKKDVVVPEYLRGELKQEVTEEEYLKMVENPRYAAFLNPLKETYETRLKMRSDLSAADRETVLNILLKSGIPDQLNIGSIHRLFDGCALTYNQEFFDFLSKNFEYFLESQEKQSSLKTFQRGLENAIKYYQSRGNSNPTFQDILTYLENVPFEFGFGMDEFAQEVKNAGVKSQETYSFYEALKPAMESRKLSTIPRHEKTYVYTDKKGKKYKVLTKILRMDDPANMLVGESKFTNCCQVYHNAGQKCMEHAATSQNGGILATYLINDEGVPEMLTQSWVWTLESKLCLDNVEATSLITVRNSEFQRLYQDIATFGIIEAAKDLMATSKQAVEEYIAKKKKEIESSDLTPKQKAEELKKLEVFRARQTLKIVTVGEGCDDLRVRETFKDVESILNSSGPKHYEGYRDSGVAVQTEVTPDGLSTGGRSKQHIIIKSDEEILPIDEEYEDVAFYRDERRIAYRASKNIPHSTLRHITKIETDAHREEMRNYTKEDKPTLVSVEKLAETYGCDVESLRVLAGEDWYYVYVDNGSTIEIVDMAKTTPRLPDELDKQQEELKLAFNTILSQSVVVQENKPPQVKQIKVDLREDTSYLLYLMQKKLGIVEQVGDDLVYEWKKDEEKKPITPRQQEEILKHIKEIRKGGNKSLKLHKVCFKATDKTIQKIVEDALAKLKDGGIQI